MCRHTYNIHYQKSWQASYYSSVKSCCEHQSPVRLSHANEEKRQISSADGPIRAPQIARCRLLSISAQITGDKLSNLRYYKLNTISPGTYLFKI